MARLDVRAAEGQMRFLKEEANHELAWRKFSASKIAFVRKPASFRPVLPRSLAVLALALGGMTLILVRGLNGLVADDQKIVAGLDTQYQAAVKENDAATMDRILADDFVLVTGSGKKYTKADLLTEARGGHVQYEHQEDTEQTVRVWRDTAVVTTKLWEKGSDNGKPFDYTVWFSDTYVRTPNGWMYVFGQSSLPLPKPSQP